MSVHGHIDLLSCPCHIIRALARAKSSLAKTLQEKLKLDCFLPTKRGRNNKKIQLGSFRFHYNWCSSYSSRMRPFPDPVLDGFSTNYLYHYDPTWDLMIMMEPAAEESAGESQLSKYLEWLEEKKDNEVPKNGTKTGTSEGVMDEIEIDKLAGMFVAKCHQRFILERQESNRRFEEKMAI